MDKAFDKAWDAVEALDEGEIAAWGNSLDEWESSGEAGGVRGIMEDMIRAAIDEEWIPDYIPGEGMDRMDHLGERMKLLINWLDRDDRAKSPSRRYIEEMAGGFHPDEPETWMMDEHDGGDPTNEDDWVRHQDSYGSDQRHSVLQWAVEQARKLRGD